jgi:chorismate mutase/prephenate dehydratase
LENLRKDIDKIDGQIARLIARRVTVAEEIGHQKMEMHKAVEDKEREKVILENVRAIAAKEGISQRDIENIYHQIVTVSKSFQAPLVAFQGEIGAYSEEAAFTFFGPSVQVRPCESLDGVFKMVERDEARFGIIPIENSIEGSIARSYDLLLDSSLNVRDEIELKISHCLIAGSQATLDTIKRIYSHPQALGQCHNFLKHLNCELIPTYDTAGAVKMIKERGISDDAAIAGLRAAEIYGMRIIAREIEDNPNNYTRFFILAKESSSPTGHDKTSIVFSVKHKPGALFAFLTKMADYQINLTKIESRPTRQKAWEYNFYLDFEGHHEEEQAKKALADLSDSALFLKVLGSYPKAKD